VQRRRIAALVAAATLALAGVLLLADPLVDGLTGIVQWLTGTGRLSWRDESGWHETTEAESRRRLWGPRDAFLPVPTTELAPGLRYGEIPLRRAGSPAAFPLVVARIDPTRWRFAVHGRPAWEPGSVRDLAEEGAMVVGLNASYFTAEGPLGLVVQGGTIRNRQGTTRAAHFLVRGRNVDVVNERRTSIAGVNEGVQGFPAIMTRRRTFNYMRVGGRGFSPWVVDRRSAVCTDGGGWVIFAATDTLASGLTLDELATVMGGLGCVDAMGLDGGSSTGMWVRVGGVERFVANPERVPVVVGVVSVPG
jgi:hypothetical protein